MKRHQTFPEGEELKSRQMPDRSRRAGEEESRQIHPMIQFDRERVPERVIFAKGAGAFGVFQPYPGMARYTKADFLQSQERMTKVFVRFSAFLGSQGSSDTERDLRGFETRFYTREGNFDLQGCSLPVFFLRDDSKFIDMVHAMKPAPDTNVRSRERFWEFIARTPETTHILTWLYTDRGTVKDYIHMDGWGVNTYVWVNANGNRCYARCHFKTMQGLQTFDRQKARGLNCSDPDFAMRSLYQAIADGNFPRYELRVQIMYPEDFAKLSFDPLDDTKIWPEHLFPHRKVGILTLNENPHNFLRQVEQSAISPGNAVPGIVPSAEPMFRNRAFCCLDAQRYRIGEHFRKLPVNQSITRNLPAFDEEKGYIAGTPHYKPDDFTQAGEHYRSMTLYERQCLHDNLAAELYACREALIGRVLHNLGAADKRMEREVAAAVKSYQTGTVQRFANDWGK
ncbi:MAG: catalase [Lachnospiraceae bacterium]|nr:catalase [Lachnospiraceae bacterium]